jgi:hypothetical protein
MTERVLVNSPYLLGTADDGLKLVRMVRSATPFPSLEALRQSNAERERMLAPLHNLDYGLLLDARLGPIRNDPDFEAESGRARLEMFTHFSRVAILVRTHTGLLQMERLQRVESSQRGAKAIQAFLQDEAAALAFLAARG